MKTTSITLASAAVAAIATASSAQETQPEPMNESMHSDVAQQCLDDLRTFGERMDEDGYWLTGIRDRWGTAGWGGVATGTGSATGYYPGVGLPTSPMARDPSVTGTADATGMTGARPVWGLGIHAPGVQIETLFRASQVLAIRGDQEGCDAVLSELRQLYDDYASQLAEAGVEPGEVTNWRREMLLTAQPVSEMDLGRVSIGEITGTEVRNLQDERLGDIDDVVVTDGQVEHVVLSRGGFLGLGEDYVVVPWERLSATPGLNMFLLDVREEALERAPKVSGDVLGLSDAQRSEVETFWQQAGSE
jgi:sporulation protein YlmC with PRC-barrel domain